MVLRACMRVRAVCALGRGAMQILLSRGDGVGVLRGSGVMWVRCVLGGCPRSRLFQGQGGASVPLRATARPPTLNPKL